MMKPTKEQLNDPQWWDKNVKDGLDYCFTTGPEWSGGKAAVGSFEFANKDGVGVDFGLFIGRKCWVLHSERPEYEGNNEKHDAVVAGYHERLGEELNKPEFDQKFEPEFIPEAGQWCEVESDIRNVWKKAMYIGLDSVGSHVFDVEGQDLWRIHSIGILVRPIKSERDKFIEKALVATGAPKDWGDMFGTLYDADFKAPEGEE